MLQNIGDTLKGQRWLAMLILGLLILVFALWGTAGLVDLTIGAPSYGVKVNGEEVAATTLQEAWQERQSQYQQQLKTEISPAMRTKLQEQLLDQYIRETALHQRAKARGFRVGDDAVAKAYQSESAFQVNGRFDPLAAKGMLAQMGMSAAAYETQLRSALQISQLEQSMELGDFLTDSEVKRAFALENEQRAVRYALLPLAGYAAAVKVDEAQAKAWYEAHLEDFMSKDSVRLQYAELRLDTVAAALTVNPADLEAWYQQNQGRYVEPEKRRARHILITVGGKDAAADAAALARAQQVLKALRAGGDFSAMAKQYSQDPGSARQGGDLGWALRGAYVQAFADKLFSMKAGETSEPVKTQFGYHIIHLDEIQASHSKTLADARSQIEADYRRERASDLFGDRQERLQQKLESSANADLPALAKEFGLTLGEVPEYTRGGGGPLGVNAELSNVVFSDAVLKDQHVGGPVALAEDRMVIVKVLEHHPPKAQPLSEVRAEVDASVRKEAGTRAARAAASAALKELKAGESFEAVAKRLDATITNTAWMARGDPQPPAQIRDAAFAATAPGADQKTYEAVTLDEGGAALVEVLSIKPGAPGANGANDQQLISSLSQRHREADFAAYVAEIQRNATVRRNMAVFN